MKSNRSPINRLMPPLRILLSFVTRHHFFKSNNFSVFPILPGIYFAKIITFFSRTSLSVIVIFFGYIQFIVLSGFYFCTKIESTGSVKIKVISSQKIAHFAQKFRKETSTTLHRSALSKVTISFDSFFVFLHTSIGVPYLTAAQKNYMHSSNSLVLVRGHFDCGVPFGDCHSANVPTTLPTTIKINLLAHSVSA
jgi:hypothetical protein